MAEATVDQRPLKFFCHKCAAEIRPNLPEYTCPRCQSGFIEEVTENSPAANVPEEPDEMEEPNLGHFFELLLNSGRLPPGGSSRDTTAHENEEHDLHPPSGLPLFGPRARIVWRGDPPHLRQQQFQGLLEQLLTGVTRAATMGRSDMGGVNFSVPFLNVQGDLHGNLGDYAWGAGGLDNIISQLLNQLEGSGPPPAEKSQIDKIPTVKVSQSDVDRNAQCSVCFEDFQLEESVRQLPCQHIYHSECIVRWLERNGTCPVCRKNLSGEDPHSQRDSTDEPSSSSGASGTSSDRFFPYEEDCD